MPNISPAEQECPSCKGCGFDLAGDTCPPCGRLGRIWLPGGPLFGCQMTLGDREIGEVVTLGTGHRGRIVRQNENGTPTTSIALIGDFDGVEERNSTTFPSAVGVLSVAVDSYVRKERRGRGNSREDHLDPLQRRAKQS